MKQVRFTNKLDSKWGVVVKDLYRRLKRRVDGRILDE